MKPSIKRVVHYVNIAARDGYPSTCRAAIVTEVPETVEQMDNSDGHVVCLAILHPWGSSFNREVRQSETEHHGNTWHWPERTDG